MTTLRKRLVAALLAASLAAGLGAAAGSVQADAPETEQALSSSWHSYASYGGTWS